MNRLNARIAYWYNVAEFSASFTPTQGGLLTPDREIHARAVREQHAYCDIAGAIRGGRGY